MSDFNKKLSLFGGGSTGFQDVHIGNGGDGGVGATVTWTSEVNRLGARDCVINDKNNGTADDVYWLVQLG